MRKNFGGEKFFLGAIFYSQKVFGVTVINLNVYFNIIKMLLNKYKESGDLKDRLIFNHLTVLFNVFGTQPSLRMLFLKLDGYHSEILPFLDVMGVSPDKIDRIGIHCKDIFPDEIVRDKIIAEQLKRNLDG